ncbi:MAG: MFS transporter [Clostridiales Family XIII bacterium]|nr:MFS transporter [Clostridiales Family XIII bacterium]
MEKLWNKNFILTLVSNGFYAVVFFTLMATVAEYAVTRYHATEAIAGLCVSIFVIGALFARMVSGILLDVAGRRTLLLIGGICCAAGSLLYFAPVGLAGFLAVRTVNGMAWGVVCNLLNIVVIDFIPPGRLGEGIGYYTMGNPIGSGIGPLVGIFLVDHFGNAVQLVFITVISVLPMLLLPMIGVREQRSAAARRIKIRLSDTFEKKAVPISSVTIIMTICFSALPAFMQLYTAERGAAWAAPFYFVTYSAVVVLIRPASGRILDRHGDNPLIFPTMLLFAAGVFVLSVSGHAAMFFVVALLCAVGYGSFFSAFQAIAVKVSPPERSGLAMSTIYSFADTGMGLGPFIWGGVVRGVGYAHTFMIEAAVIVASILIYYGVHGKKYLVHKASKI